MWICVPFFISSNCSSNLIVSRGLLVDATCTQPFCTFVPKNKKLGVGGYTEEVLEWFNYSRYTVHCFQNGTAITKIVATMSDQRNTVHLISANHKHGPR